MMIGKNPYVYLAGPFFNPQQLKQIEETKCILEHRGFKYFSPKDECLFQPGVTTPEGILTENIAALNCTNLLVCITDGKDPGTFFEAGWCYAMGIPIVYIWLTGEPGQKFNLVLAASGSVVRSYHELDKALYEIRETGVFNRRNWGSEEMNYE
jgi:nucleoside 2-deoxyribosyltransferase